MAQDFLILALVAIATIGCTLAKADRYLASLAGRASAQKEHNR